MPIYPIGFSIQKSKIVDSVPEKKRLLAPLIPGDISTYIYNNETDYYNSYKESILDRKSTRLNSSHIPLSRMPSSA